MRISDRSSDVCSSDLLRVQGVDLALKPLHLAFDHPQHRAARLVGPGWRRQVGPEVEQLVLNAPENGVEFGLAGGMHPRQAGGGVADRTSVVGGKGVSGSVDIAVRRIIKNNNLTI